MTYDLDELLAAINKALAEKGLPGVESDLDGLAVKFPQAAAFFSSLKDLARSLIAAVTTGNAVPEAFADAIKTLKEGSGPVDTSGGHTV